MRGVGVGFGVDVGMHAVRCCDAMRCGATWSIIHPSIIHIISYHSFINLILQQGCAARSGFTQPHPSVMFLFFFLFFFFFLASPPFLEWRWGVQASKSQSEGVSLIEKKKKECCQKFYVASIWFGHPEKKKKKEVISFHSIWGNLVWNENGKQSDFSQFRT